MHHSCSRLCSAVALVFVVLCSFQDGRAEGATGSGTPGHAAAPKKAPKKEQTEFMVRLTSFGTSKIAVIKAVRDATGLGLKETKDLVESAPVVVKTGLGKAEAEALQKSLVSAGATAEVAPAGASTAGSTAAPKAAPKKGQKEFTVRLTSFGANKISVIKVVRDATGLGLKETKDLVESAPTVVKEGLSKADAEALQKALVNVGATVEVE